MQKPAGHMLSGGFNVLKKFQKNRNGRDQDTGIWTIFSRAWTTQRVE